MTKHNETICIVQNRLVDINVELYKSIKILRSFNHDTVNVICTYIESAAKDLAIIHDTLKGVK